MLFGYRLSGIVPSPTTPIGRTQLFTSTEIMTAATESPSARSASLDRPADAASSRFAHVLRGLSTLQNSLLALLSLVMVGAVALGVMVVTATAMRLISPSRRFDLFRAFHEPLVVGVLFGLVVLWVLPPHPWVEQKSTGSIDESTVVDGEGGSFA
jgi:hypothetical protein